MFASIECIRADVFLSVEQAPPEPDQPGLALSPDWQVKTLLVQSRPHRSPKVLILMHQTSAAD